MGPERGLGYGSTLLPRKKRAAPCRSRPIGLTGFEPATSSPPVKRATKLRYSPD